MSAFPAACERGDVDMVLELLLAGANPCENYGLYGTRHWRCALLVLVSKEPRRLSITVIDPGFVRYHSDTSPTMT